MNQKFNRRLLREKALQILYAYEYNREGLTNLISGILTDIISKEDKEFVESVVQKVIIHNSHFDDLVKSKAENWELERIALIDKILLRIGLAELMHFPEIPPKVTINEVIEIAKEYSTANSGKFINGILDSILNDLKESGKLNKKGRGLVEQSIPKKITKK